MTHQLTKKLQHLKKKIKQFEEQFEKERNYKVRSNLSCSSLILIMQVHYLTVTITGLVFPSQNIFHWPCHYIFVTFTFRTCEVQFIEENNCFSVLSVS